MSVKTAQKPVMPKPDAAAPAAVSSSPAMQNKPAVPKPAAPASIPNEKTTPVNDLPKATNWYIKDPNTGRIFPLESGQGQTLRDSGWVEPFSSDMPLTPAQIAGQAPTQQADEHTGTGNAAFYQQGVTPVKEMQKSLIALSKDIASHDIQNTPDRSLDTNDTLTGANPFMNFLVNSYMNSAQMSGKQFLNTDEKQPARMDTAKQNDNFKGVLKTIQRIGTPNAEQIPDGNWGPRTNNSLKQIYALAYALMEVQKDMGMAVSGYTESDLSELHSNIPENIEKVNINDKVQKAAVISKNLNKFRVVYDNFRDKVLDNAEDKAKISQTKALYTKQAPVKSAPGLTDYEKKLYEKYKSTELDIDLNGHKISIMPYNLSNMSAFKKYLVSHAQQIGLTPADIDSIKKGDEKKVNDMLLDVSNSLTGAQ